MCRSKWDNFCFGCCTPGDLYRRRPVFPLPGSRCARYPAEARTVGTGLRRHIFIAVSAADDRTLPLPLICEEPCSEAKLHAFAGCSADAGVPIEHVDLVFAFR